MKTAGNQSKNSFTPKKFALSGQIRHPSIAANLLCKFQEKSMNKNLMKCSHVLSVSVSVCVCMQCKSVLTLIPTSWGCSKMWLEMDWWALLLLLLHSSSPSPVAAAAAAATDDHKRSSPTKPDPQQDTATNHEFGGVRYLSSNQGWSRASEQAAWEPENSSTVTKQGPT